MVLDSSRYILDENASILDARRRIINDVIVGTEFISGQAEAGGLELRSTWLEHSLTPVSLCVTACDPGDPALNSDKGGVF
jgi:hypothetical protein